jgi:hypothetical protein
VADSDGIAGRKGLLQAFIKKLIEVTLLFATL